MTKRLTILLVALILFVTACATHRAKRVDCDGPLQPINAPRT